MNLGKRFGSFFVKFFDELVKDGVAGLVAVDFDEKPQGFIVLDDWHGFFTKFFDAGFKDVDIDIVFAFATVVELFCGFETLFDVGFGDVQNNNGFNFVSSAGGDGHDLVFFAFPATDRREN